MTPPRDPDADEALRLLFALLEIEPPTHLRISSSVPAAPASGPVESLSVHESLERLVAAEAPSHAASEPAASATDLVAAMNEGLDEAAPASSRRPVLPDDAAPALPDLRWDDTPLLAVDEEDAPPESGPTATDGEPDPDSHEVTGVRSATGFALPGALGARELAAAFESPRPATFAALLDEALSL